MDSLKDVAAIAVIVLVSLILVGRPASTRSYIIERSVTTYSQTHTGNLSDMRGSIEKQR